MGYPRRAHYSRNLATKVPKSARPWVSPLVRTIFEQPGAASVRAQHAQVVTTLEAKFPAAAHLDEAREDLLAFAAFPRGIWRQIWSNNPQERLNKGPGAGPASSASSPPARPLSASPARYWPSRTTNGPKRAATWGWRSSPHAGKPPKTAEAGENDVTIDAIGD